MKMPTPSIQINVRLRPDEYERLAAIALSEGTTVVGLLRRLLAAAERQDQQDRNRQASLDGI